ncbi:hypothetical protein N7462_009122, partial [Penicillium macrosclerotiorum]|uniref:uncharacterized protein n=1 Tax=Penicillium macrosclerotiorum TaxID=303699 RepID=UPI0025469E91
SWPAAHLANLARYNVTLNYTGASLAVRGQSGGSPAIPLIYDVEYLCPVTAGGQTLYLDFDTGSAELLTLKLLPGFTWDITHADGSGAGGNLYYDAVAVGSLVGLSQAIEPAIYVSSSFASNPFSSGLLGLAFSTINTANSVEPIKQQTFFETVLPTLNMPLFTANLKHGKPCN